MMNLNTFKDFLPILKEKWKEIPAGLQTRLFSSDLLAKKKNDFINDWENLYIENCEGEGFQVRGWYHKLYESLAKQGGNWIEIGSGLGYDGTYFATKGANLTFCDIIEDNLRVIERICNYKKIKNVSFILLKDLEEIKLFPCFDIVIAIGSLINTPLEIAQKERFELFNKLNPGGRWLELAYPKERWIKEGSLSPQDWAKRTDGENTPWVEWYDLNKLLSCFKVNSVKVILNTNFKNNDFNWFDLEKNKNSQLIQ